MVLNIEDSQIIKIGEVLKDVNRPLKERFRALFTLKNIGGELAIKCIESVFADSSALLKHELAYCLGQMQDPKANEVLKRVLEDNRHEPIVRHEAAEAMGAIATPTSIDILEKYLNDKQVEVSQTCKLAIERINWLQSNGCDKTMSENLYNSVDPTPACNNTNIQELKAILLDENRSLYERYQAMFQLRNLRTPDAVLALCDGLKINSPDSALFKHEIAFVLGQLQDELSVPQLTDVLADVEENEMVRHECAEALGAIATEDCYTILKKYLKDEKRVVKESCEIALDMCDYENSPEFQYANGLVL